jgi:hypothetical protein
MELTINLFKSYETIEDAKFYHFIQYTQYGYTATPKAYNTRILMNSVENPFRTHVKAGTWPTSVTDKEGIPSFTSLEAEGNPK